MNLFYIIVLTVLIGSDPNDVATALAIEQSLQNPISSTSEIDEAALTKKIELKKKFEEELVKICSKKSTKHFEMTVEDSIEKRAIKRVQIEHVIDV